MAKDGATVISGHRRRQGAIIAGLSHVPVIVTQYDDLLDIQQALIIANRQRQKTHEQLAREFAELKRIESERAARSLVEKRLPTQAGTAMDGPSATSEELRASLPVVSGRARERAAEMLGGMSPRNFEKAEKVVERIDTLAAEGSAAQAEALRTDLNKSVHKAFQQVREPAAKKADPIPKSTQQQTKKLLADALAALKPAARLLDEARTMHGGESAHSRTAMARMADLKTAIFEWQQAV